MRQGGRGGRYIPIKKNVQKEKGYDKTKAEKTKSKPSCE